MIGLFDRGAKEADDLACDTKGPRRCARVHDFSRNRLLSSVGEVRVAQTIGQQPNPERIIDNIRCTWFDALLESNVIDPERTFALANKDVRIARLPSVGVAHRE